MVEKTTIKIVFYQVHLKNSQMKLGTKEVLWTFQIGMMMLFKS